MWWLKLLVASHRMRQAVRARDAGELELALWRLDETWAACTVASRSTWKVARPAALSLLMVAAENYDGVLSRLGRREEARPRVLESRAAFRAAVEENPRLLEDETYREWEAWSDAWLEG